MAKFHTLCDMRPSGMTYDVNLDRIVAISETRPNNGYWHFYVMVEIGVEQASYWAAHYDRERVEKWRADLMAALDTNSEVVQTIKVTSERLAD